MSNKTTHADENTVPLPSGPWILADGKRLQFRDYQWKREGGSFEVLEIIDRALVVSPEERIARTLWLQNVLSPVQQAWALKLAQALDSLEPGLTECLPAIALKRLDQPSYCNRSPFPSMLDKPEILAMACAYLYWRDDPDQAPMPWTTLNKVCGVKAVQLAQHLHSAVGVIPCPICGRDAEAKIVKRIASGKSNQRPEGELICGACGHTEHLTVGNPTERPDAAVLSCGCNACAAKTEALRMELRASLAGLASRIAKGAAGIADSVQQLARNFNAAPLTRVAAYNATNAITGAPRHGTLVNIDRYPNEDWPRGGRSVVDISTDDLTRFLSSCKGGADLKVEAFVDCDDAEGLTTWCLGATRDTTLPQLLAVPDERDAFREWIREARRTTLLMGFIPLPITIELTLRESPAPSPQPPMDSGMAPSSSPPARSVRQQSDFQTRIADAIALLTSNGYVVVHQRNLE